MISINLPSKPSKYRRLKGFAFVYGGSKGPFYIYGDYFQIKETLQKITCCYFYNIKICQQRISRNWNNNSWAGMAGMIVTRTKRNVGDKKYLYCVRFFPCEHMDKSPQVVTAGIYWYRRMPHAWLPEWNKHVKIDN